MPRKSKVAISIEEELDTLIRWGVDVDYDTTNNCEEEGCDSICRCGQINNARVKNVNFHHMWEELQKRCNTPMEKYCLERLLIHSGLRDFTRYNIRVTRGYYGEEIDKVTFDAADDVAKSISQMLKAPTDKEKLFCALKAEYGYILPNLQGCTVVQIAHIPVALLSVGVMGHYKKLDKEIIKKYKDRETKENGLPKVVVKSDNGRWSLVDGYHRFAANEGERDILAVTMI